MFKLLEQLVLTQSFTRNKGGVDRVGELICGALARLPLEFTRFSQEEFGDHLLFKTAACSPGKPFILLCGHMDTVFPPDTAFNWYREDDDRAFGPGVIDMKGGLVVFISGLQRLAASGRLDGIPLALFCNSDEEIGSPSSIPILRELARDASCGLVAECGGLNSEVVTGRRGKRGIHLQVKGRAGHAAFAGAEKASAVLELAKKTIALETLNDSELGNVVNVGRVEGGITMNAVAETAEALIDTRFTSPENGDVLFAKIKKLIDNRETPGTSSTITVTNERPVMVGNESSRAIFTIVHDLGRELGMKIGEEFRQGVSDANTIAGEGVPVIDGLGPVGDCDHSDREYMVKASLPARVELVEKLLPRLAGM
ncbi:MAG: M20 family metallopeptidase [Thermodesulfobacteriota bacterium]